MVSPRGTYLIIADQLRKALQGDNPPEALTESELVAQHGVVRNTARRALHVLRDEGLIRSVPGKGWTPVGADERPLVDRVTDVFHDDGLEVGGPFPPESELCVRFKASRGTLRHVLAQLEGQGLITTAQGKGRTVKALPASNSQKEH